MTSKNTAALSSFIEGAPPGELDDVVAGHSDPPPDCDRSTYLYGHPNTDIKALTADEPSLLDSARLAFEKYNEEQLATVKLPGESQHVLVSAYNSLGNGRYYDIESHTSFAFDHTTQKASSIQSHALDSRHTDLITSLLKVLSIHAREHYPSASFSVFPTDSDSTLAILLVANKYSPSNFWNGRWRTTYILNPSTSQLAGTIKVDVHYYEDGNVRLTTTKPVSLSLSSSANASEVVRQIAAAEKTYQEALNRGFAALSEGSFKALRRQLPVTRQKVEWEKIGTYRLGQDIGGGRGR